MVTKNSYILFIVGSIFIASASLSHASDKYTIIYDSINDIKELVEHTFLAHVDNPTQDQLLKPIELAKANDTILKFVEKKNKILGIKNDDVDTVAKQFYSVTKELIQQVAILQGSITPLGLADPNARSIVLKIHDIDEKCDQLKAKIAALLAKKFSLLTANGKNLLKMLNELIQSVQDFDLKMENMIRTMLGWPVE